MQGIVSRAQLLYLTMPGIVKKYRLPGHFCVHFCPESSKRRRNLQRPGAPTGKKGNAKMKHYKPSKTQTAAEEIGAHISTGNIKTGSIPSFSLTPGRTCTPEACKTCFKEGCYAEKVYKLRPTVRAAWDSNTSLAVKHEGIEKLEKFLNLYFDGMTAPRFFRLHVGGDFVSKEYAEMWARVAKKHPLTKFLAFTKAWDMVRDVKFPKNFSLVLSGWPGTEIPEDLNAKYSKAYCVMSEEEIPDTAINCPGQCEDCGACWALAQMKTDVYFVKH